MNWETLLCFGDSITIGARTYLGYPEYAGDYLQKGTGKHWNVLNVAVSGFTARDLCRKITTDSASLIHAEAGFFTLLIGTNDLKKQTSLDNFTIAYEQTLLKILLLTRHRNGLLLLLPQLGKGVKHPYKYAMNEQVDALNEVISTTGRKYGVPTLAMDIGNEHYCDGVHLNEVGCKVVGSAIATYILGEKGIDSVGEMQF